METLQHILASFDIFQVILNIFPQIFNPLAHAFEIIFGMLYTSAKGLVTANPGLVSGTLLFVGTYGILTAILNRRKLRTAFLRK
jgi:hypothetical protein